TTLLITAEPLINQSTITNNQNTTTLLSSSNSSLTSSTKSNNLIINSSSKNSISPFSSTFNTGRCRSDEQLLTCILPDKCRGVILDLRTQNETKKPQATSRRIQDNSQQQVLRITRSTQRRRNFYGRLLERDKEAFTSTCQEVLGRNKRHHTEWISIETLDKIQERENKKTAINNSRTITEKIKAQSKYTEAKKQRKSIKADKRKYVKEQR
ncbi:unnamed protein product, partial [Schistosoma mattheei]